MQMPITRMNSSVEPAALQRSVSSDQRINVHYRTLKWAQHMISTELITVQLRTHADKPHVYNSRGETFNSKCTSAPVN
jgi:hypothetical protein